MARRDDADLIIAVFPAHFPLDAAAGAAGTKSAETSTRVSSAVWLLGAVGPTVAAHAGMGPFGVGYHPLP